MLKSTKTEILARRDKAQESLDTVRVRRLGSTDPDDELLTLIEMKCQLSLADWEELAEYVERRPTDKGV